MSDERSNRRTSILKNPADITDMNKTKNGGVSRRVSFHNHRTVQHFDTDHGLFRQEPKNEYLSLSSISSGDELTKNSANQSHQQQTRAPLSDLNADQNEVRKPLSEKKKPRHSMGADDTRHFFSKANESANLTLQFGARPTVNETLSDDNTQALFEPAQQTCTEAFFAQIHENNSNADKAQVKQRQQEMTMNNELTEDFLEGIASQAQARSQLHAQVQDSPSLVLNDTLDGRLSPRTIASSMHSSKKHFVAPEEVAHGTVHSTHASYLDQTVPKSGPPMPDETIPQVDQNTESPVINQTFATSFQPEISSYVLHDNSSTQNDQLKSLREGLNFNQPPVSQQKRDLQPSFSFEDTLNNLIDFGRNEPMQTEQFAVQEEEINEREVMEVMQEDEELANMSQQITLYEDILNDPKKNFPNATYQTQEFLLEDSHALLSKGTDPTSDFNRTVEMEDRSEQEQPASQDTQNPLYKTYAVPEQSPNLTYVVPTPVVKAKAHEQDTDTTIIHSFDDDTVLSSGSNHVHQTLNETRDKIVEVETKISRRVSASFRQILADAKLNRSVQMSPVAESSVVDSPASNCPPLKQARLFNKSTDSPRNTSKSFAVPTAVQKTPQPNVRKSQKPVNALQILSANRNSARAGNDSTRMSTPTRYVKDTPTMRQATPKAVSVQRPIAFATPTVQNGPREQAKFNPMHGPVQLKSVQDLKWAQQLRYDPNWLKAERVSQWNPLPDDYFDHNGATAGLEKDELRQKAETIMIRAINKFGGDMNLVRKYVFELSELNAKQAKPSKDQMWALKAKHDQLVDHYNERVENHNQLIKQLRDKRHTENKQFIADIKKDLQLLVQNSSS